VENAVANSTAPIRLAPRGNFQCGTNTNDFLKFTSAKYITRQTTSG
jgi:hypothetical protein